MGPEETTNLGASQERWIPDPNDHARFCISATSQTVLYMIFFKLKLVLIDAIQRFFDVLSKFTHTHTHTKREACETSIPILGVGGVLARPRPPDHCSAPILPKLLKPHRPRRLQGKRVCTFDGSARMGAEQ